MTESMKQVVITGVSTGIGYAATKVLTTNGFHVFGGVRKQGDADRLSNDFGAAFTPLVMDVTDEIAVRAASDLVRQKLQGKTLAGLINNAGINVASPLLHVRLKDWRQVLEVNLTGPLLVTQAFAPLIGTDQRRQGPPGRIINIGSVSGKRAFPFLGSYIASKYGLEGFTDTLRMELQLYGIKVVLIGPGSVATPMYEKADRQDASELMKTDYAAPLSKFKQFALERWKNALSPVRVGEIILKALTVPHPRMRYAVVGRPFRDWILPQLLSKRMFNNALAKRFGLTVSR